MTILVNVKKKYSIFHYEKKMTEVLKWLCLLIEAEKLRLDLLLSQSLHVNVYIKYTLPHTYQFKQISYNLYKRYLGRSFFLSTKIYHENYLVC